MNWINASHSATSIRADRGPSAARRASSGGEICATVTEFDYRLSIIRIQRPGHRRNAMDNEGHRNGIVNGTPPVPADDMNGR
jgi:hypothetical protein